jgi:hypothetical protein
VPNAASTNVAGTAVPSALDSRDSSKSVDFSKITPRKLQAYLDERLMSGHVDGPDGLYCSTLFSAIPGELYAEQPDVPVDLTETIKSMSDFARNHGESKLVSLYNGLSDWMKMMEAQSVRISVVA